MEIWEYADELRIALAQHRWVNEVKRWNPAMGERLAHAIEDDREGRATSAALASA
jgi:hypothetical protein